MSITVRADKGMVTSPAKYGRPDAIALRKLANCEREMRASRDSRFPGVANGHEHLHLCPDCRERRAFENSLVACHDRRHQELVELFDPNNDDPGRSFPEERIGNSFQVYKYCNDHARRRTARAPTTVSQDLAILEGILAEFDTSAVDLLFRAVRAEFEYIDNVSKSRAMRDAVDEYLRVRHGPGVANRIARKHHLHERYGQKAAANLRASARNARTRRR